MKTFDFYQDQKVTTWDRVYFSITAENIEEAKSKLKEFRDKEIENDESLGIQISHCEYQPETSESITVEENGGCSTLEMYTKDGEEVMDNTPEPCPRESFRCSECGSTNIQIQAWVAPNRNNEFVSDCEENECWCDSCEQHSKIISHSELNSIDLANTKSTEFLSKGETIIRICPNTKRPVLVIYEGNERCLCLHDDSVKEDRQAIDDWLSVNNAPAITERIEISDEDDTLESILEDTDKCERFAEVILDEIRTDEEQPHHIGSNIIKAYQNSDCDALLIALCGWSMDSLLNKFNENKPRKPTTCPQCYNESLKYAMIDIDGTNLEEGYSCSECGANFIGLENEDVIEANS